MNYSIIQFGKPLATSKYTIDVVNKTFSSKEDNLVLDFSNLNSWLFKTGNSCTFKTGSFCTFKTYGNCMFKTYSNCMFKTYSNCTFNTHGDCTFKTADYCTFHTHGDCTFTIGTKSIISLEDVCTHKFTSHDDVSIILDKADNEHYILNQKLLDYIKLLKL